MKTGSERRKKMENEKKRADSFNDFNSATNLQFCESANPGLDPVDVSG